MKKIFFGILSLLLGYGLGNGREWHVALNGEDAGRGTRAGPLRSIQRAAELAQPGDTITVHEGVYRERVNPPRGGTSERKRIVYQAARGEKVEIKGSEAVSGWARVQGDVWKATLTNAFFGSFNPYQDVIHGDWFVPRSRQHHTGAVYLNGEWLTEATTLEEVLSPPAKAPAWFTHSSPSDWEQAGLWFAKVDAATTTIFAQFKGVDPNRELVEINVRRTVFYPDKPGRNYITVRGFTLKHAATPWAPPTAEQIGLIGTHWSRGWVIENNEVSHSICSGIALGKYGDEWDNTSANTAEGYVKTIERALQNGWTPDNIGHHIVRNNSVSHCEQAGIVGSLGAAFSTVSGNTIHDIHVRRHFTGAEMAGIKFHGAIDSVIQGNHIYRTCLGLWLDWMAQGTRVSDNLFHDNRGHDLFVEVDHGPFVVDNNFLLSETSLLDMSEGGAYAHNLFAGKVISRPELSRATPFHPPHATTVAGLVNIKGGDNRFYNNIFVGCGQADSKNAAAFGLCMYDPRELPLLTGGNVFFNGARPYVKESDHLQCGEADLKMKLRATDDRVELEFDAGAELARARTRLVTTALLGRAKIPQLGYENADGSPLKIDRDFFGKKRSPAHPTPGPFEQSGTNAVVLRLR